MELFLLIAVVLLSLYPYFLVIKLLRLACKALKKYLSE